MRIKVIFQLIKILLFFVDTFDLVESTTKSVIMSTVFKRRYPTKHKNAHRRVNLQSWSDKIIRYYKTKLTFSCLFSSYDDNH